MPFIASIDTYLRCWGSPLHQVAGDDEDAVDSCAIGHDASRKAVFGAASGAFDAALVMGADELRDTTTADMLWGWEAMARDTAWDCPLGLVAPTGFALPVRRYLHESPATEELLAMVAVKNHRHGVNNPKAQLRFEITMEQALNAPTVVTPFRILDCAPQSDGAAALVMAAEESAVDVDVAEVHDFLTGIESMSSEDLDFAERLGGDKLLEAEVTSVGGTLPVNPSGGLNAKGHPPGVTGVAQCTELFQRLPGEAVNQVDGARVALAHDTGGPTAVAGETILEGPGGLA